MDSQPQQAAKKSLIPIYSIKFGTLTIKKLQKNSLEIIVTY